MSLYLKASVAIRRGIYDRFSRDIAASPWSVLDHELLAQTLREPLPNQTSANVVHSSWSKSDYDPYRPYRISLSARDVRHDRKSSRTSSELQKSTTWKFHCSPLDAGRYPPVHIHRRAASKPAMNSLRRIDNPLHRFEEAYSGPSGRTRALDGSFWPDPGRKNRRKPSGSLGPAGPAGGIKAPALQLEQQRRRQTIGGWGSSLPKMTFCGPRRVTPV
jgi:hypothetical protein